MSTMARKLQDFAKVGRTILGVAYNYKPLKRVPRDPIVFSKLASSYLPPKCENNIVIPNGFLATVDISLGVIIGEKAYKVEEGAAESFIGGYCLALDVTGHVPLDTLRKKGHPWLITKSFDTACPVSDFIPIETISNPNDIELWCKINGENFQKGNTKDMVFNVPELIAYISRFITLYPNDLILTGSPPPMMKSATLCHEDIIDCGIGKDIMKMKITVLDESQMSESAINKQ